jgi:Fe-S oxidoreductase
MTQEDVVSGTMLEPRHKKMEIDADAETETYRCVRCGFCRFACPIFDATQVDSYNCRGRIMLERALIEGGFPVDDYAMEILYTCTLCKKCEEHCPAKIKVVDVMDRVRVYLAENNYTLSEHKAIADNILDKGNTFGQDYPAVFNEVYGEIKATLPKQSSTLYYAGCVGTVDYPDNSLAGVKLLKEAGEEFMMLDAEDCCAGFLNWLGFKPYFEKAAKKNIELFKSRGIETIITACPMCASVFNEDYKEIDPDTPKAYHISEVIARLIDEGKIELTKPLEGKVTFKDPCHLGRYALIYDAPRKIIESIPGVEFVELPETKGDARCCGGPIRVPYTELRNDLSDEIVKDAAKLGVKYILTTCPTCHHSVGMRAYRERIRVLELPRLVAYSAGIVDSYR